MNLENLSKHCGYGSRSCQSSKILPSKLFMIGHHPRNFYSLKISSYTVFYRLQNPRFKEGIGIGMGGGGVPDLPTQQTPRRSISSLHHAVIQGRGVCQMNSFPQEKTNW